jgi:hypothetical protein
VRSASGAEQRDHTFLRAKARFWIIAPWNPRNEFTYVFRYPLFEDARLLMTGHSGVPSSP